MKQYKSRVILLDFNDLKLYLNNNNKPYKK